MGITSIPDVLVVGIPYDVYSFDFEAGYTKGPSSITIEFINETGNYTPPTLNTISPLTIKVGDYRYNYHPVSHTIRDTGSEKVMQVKFLDGSIILDRTYIGLRGRWGKNSSFPLMVVGEEIDVCEEDKEDPCNPCDDLDLADRQIECAKEKECRREEYDYNFGEFLAAIRGAGIRVKGGFAGNPNYRVQYTGTVRSVLQNFASDFGFTFFWENDTLCFLDLRAGIRVDTAGIESVCNVLDKTETFTLEGVEGHGSLAYYGKDCQEQTYNCDDIWCKRINMKPLQLDDIFEEVPRYDDDLGKKDLIADPFRRLELYCVMSHFSPEFRDIVSWYRSYGIKTPQDAEALEGKTLKLLGDMKIKDVYWQGAPGKSEAMFRKGIHLFFEGDPKGEKKFKEDGGYFVVAETNDKLLQDLHEWESGLASLFMGKIWYRFFNQHFKGITYSYISPDASVRYYDLREPISLPFVDLVKNDLSDVKNADALKKDDGGAGNGIEGLIDDEGRAADSFLIMQRDAVWLPPRFSSEEQKELTKFVNKYFFKGVEFPANYEHPFNAEGPEDAPEEGGEEEDQQSDRRLKMFAVISIDKDLRAKSEIIDHPEEQENVNVRVEACEQLTHYGLRSAKCRKYRFLLLDGFILEVHTPVQGYIKDSGSHPGYRVLWEKRSGDIFKKHPKIEKTSHRPPTAQNYLKVSYSYRDITNDDIDLLQDECVPDEATIQQVLDSYTSLGGYAFNGPLREVSYTLNDMPPIEPVPSKGISSFSVRIGNDGFKTRLVFSTVKPAEVSPEVHAARLNHMDSWDFKSTRAHRFPARLRKKDQQDEIEDVDD